MLDLHLSFRNLVKHTSLPRMFTLCILGVKRPCINAVGTSMSNSWPADHTLHLFKQSIWSAGCEFDVLAEGWGHRLGMEVDLLPPPASQAQGGVLCSLAEDGDGYTILL